MEYVLLGLCVNGFPGLKQEIFKLMIVHEMEDHRGAI